MAHEELMQKLKQAVIDGDDAVAQEAAEQTIQLGLDPLEIVKSSIQPAMDVVGEQFQNGEAFLPELIMSGDAAKAALNILMSQIDEAKVKDAQKGTVVLGVVFGDNHDIGKNLVMALLSAYGFKVIDLGINIPPKQFIETAIKEKANIIAMSTLITTSMPYQREVIELLKAMGKREDFYCIVGGGPVTPEWTEKIGADGYGRDAKDAALLCLKLVDGTHKAPLAKPLLENALAASSSI